MMIKGVFSLLLFFFVLCFISPMLMAQPLLGDIDADGVVSIADAIALTQYIVGITPIINTTVADVNIDGVIKMLDTLYIAQFADGTISEIPTIQPSPYSTSSGGSLPPTPPPITSPAPPCTVCAEASIFGYVYSGSTPFKGARIILESGEIIQSNADGYYSFPITGACDDSTVTVTIESENQWPVTRTVVNPGCGSAEAGGVYYNRLEITGELTGDLWFEKYKQTVVRSKTFTTPILVNSGSQRVAAYVLDIEYNPSKVSLVTTNGLGVTAGDIGFVASVNSGTVGNVRVAGFDSPGKGPGTASRFITASWKAEQTGLSMMAVDCRELIDETGASIFPRGYASYVTVVDFGDANANGKIDIIDALYVARSYIGIVPDGFFADAADVNGSGTVDIVDALMIAQYYVGIRTGFPIEEAT
jgi:hypothetical protein